ncbi:MAG: hypothetical protein WA081_00785 [Desulfosalsimonadaceae bacterium]
MKTHRLILVWTLFSFLMQTTASPILISRARAQAQTPTASAAAPRSADALFDEGVPFHQQKLIFEYIQYISNSFAPREGLRKASEELSGFLRKDDFWFSLKIKDETMADLLLEANSGRRYLIDKTGPAEARLHTEQRRIEKLLINDHENITRTGAVPDGFMERTRELAYLYDLQDQLWDMKMAMLLKISGLSNNINVNYISKHPGDYPQAILRIPESTRLLDGIIGFAATHHQQLLELKTRFQNAQNDYQTATAAKLREDRKKTTALMDAVGRRSAALNQNGTPNDRHHAELLERVNDVLQDRMDEIDQRLGRSGESEAIPNALYIPPGLGTSSESRPLADAYREIARKFVGQTGQKVDQTKKLKSSISEIRTAVQQENLFYQTLINDLNIPSEQKQKIATQSQTTVKQFIDSLKSLEEPVDAILARAATVNFQKPDEIIGSRTAASTAFRLNQQIEGLIEFSNRMDEMSLTVNLHLYGLLADIDIDQPQHRKPFEMLQASGKARNLAVTDFSQRIAAIKDIFEQDAVEARNLKKLGVDIIHQGQAFFASKTGRLTGILDRHASAAGQPYFDYLTGANEQLKTRLMVIDKMLAASKEAGAGKLPQTPCADCVPAAAVWSELAELGPVYTDTLKQLDDLADIESFYTPEKIKASQVFTDARNLFELNRRLGNTPYLHLNQNSVDVVFIAGSRMVVVKSIGDPDAAVLARVSTSVDHLTQAPYIGGWLSDIGSGFAHANDQWITPLGPSLFDRASDILSTARELGGKISTGVRFAQNTFEGVKNAIKTVGNYGSKALTLTGEWIDKAWENAFMSDPKNYSWLKIGGYVLGGAACALATAGTAGLAAPACIALAIAAGVNIAQGAVDVAAMDKYGLISQSTADWTKLGLDILGIIGGGWMNIKGAGAAWIKMGNMPYGTIRQLLTFMGLNPKDLSRILNIDWSKIKTWSKLVVPLTDAFSAIRNIPDWLGKFQDWYGKLPNMPDIGSGIGTGMNFIRNLIMGLGSLYQPLPVNAPSLIPLSPFSPFAALGGGLGGSGALLPGGGQAVGGVQQPGVSLGSTPLPTLGQMQSPGGTVSNFQNPYKDWVNPYKDWVNPYKDWVSPY